MSQQVSPIPAGVFRIGWVPMTLAWKGSQLYHQLVGEIDRLHLQDYQVLEAYQYQVYTNAVNILSHPDSSANDIIVFNNLLAYDRMGIVTSTYEEQIKQTILQINTLVVRELVAHDVLYNYTDWYLKSYTECSAILVGSISVPY